MARGRSVLCGGLAVMLVACGASSGTATEAPVTVVEAAGGSGEWTATSSADAGSLTTATTAQRAAALPMRAEAWPRRLAGEPDAVGAPATRELAFESAPEARFPWVFVLGLPGGPHEVAAVALYGVDDPRLIRDFSVLTFAGELLLDRSVWPQFLELSERVGSATLQRTAGWQLFVFPAATSASFVLLRALSNHGAETTGVGAIRLLDATMLAAFRASHPGVNAVELESAGRPGGLDTLIMPTPDEEGSASGNPSR